MRQSSVVYCNEAKIALGVPREIIDIYTVYSEDTARAMALAGLDAANADIAVGVTGSISRVDPFNQENSEPGVIYVAVAQRRKKRARYAIASRKLVFDAGERWQIQEGAVIAALDLVLSVLKQGRQGVRQ
jgi:nicotinamide mononucleotide (NMN) deamidase PncC